MNISLTGITHYTIGQSLLLPQDIVDYGDECDLSHVAITDVMSVAGAVDFVKAAKDKRVTALVGCTLDIYEDAEYQPPKKNSGEKRKDNLNWWLRVYPKNQQGMIDLNRMLSLANSGDRLLVSKAGPSKPRLGFDDALSFIEEGNLAVMFSSDFSVFRHPNHDYYVDLIMGATNNQAAFEFSTENTRYHKNANKLALAAAKKFGGYAYAHKTAVYKEAGDADTLDVMQTISTRGADMDSGFVAKRWSRDLALNDDFDKTPATIQGFVDQTQYRLEPFETNLPEPQTKYNHLYSDEDKLRAACIEGFEDRIASRAYMGNKVDPSMYQTYHDRIEMEVEIICEKGFERYFLIVQDFMMAARSKNIAVSPGRGSVGGSLVAFLLGITDIDPIRFGTMFGRFINRGRNDMPDIDCDFMSTRRGEMQDYLVSVYGEENCAAVMNYNTLGAASALRDVGRVMGLDEFEYACSKQVPDVSGASMTLEEAVQEVPDIDKFSKSHPEVWTHATKLQGKIRTKGQHASAFIVSDIPLRDRAVVETRADSHPVIDLDRFTSEFFGLLKVDILALSTLDTFQKIANLVSKKLIEAGKPPFDIYSVSLEDEPTLDLLSAGDTVGIFQLEKGTARNMLSDIAGGGRIDIMDVVAVNAMNRPGPLESGMPKQYIDTKNQKQALEVPHPSLYNLLSETYGAIIYQEQVSAITMELAGFDESKADNVRKAMGKKDKTILDALKAEFVSGCQSKLSILPSRAEEIWDTIEKFAAYGFNKSHSVGYSLLGFWMAYLKANYPMQFYIAYLEFETKNETKRVAIVNDMAKRGVSVIPPNVNISKPSTFEYEGKIIAAPFSAMKFFTEKPSQELARAIESIRASGGVVDRASLEAWAKAQKKDMKAAGISARMGLNKRHYQILEDTGAFGDPAAQLDDSFRRAQVEMIPGLVSQEVKVDRVIEIMPVQSDMNQLANQMSSCQSCSLAKGNHITPVFSREEYKGMIVFPSPNGSHDRANTMASAKENDFLSNALFDAGLSMEDFYVTSVVKSPKVGNALTTEQLACGSKFLDKEVDLLKPPLIIALGGQSIKHLLPNLKGGVLELSGQAHFDKRRDATILCSIIPAMCHYKPEHFDTLSLVAQKAANILRVA